MKEIKDILYNGSRGQRRALFGFDSRDSMDRVIFKFNLWIAFFFPQYIESDDAPFHEDINLYNLKCYREEFNFVDLAYRGAGKTLKTKWVQAFCVANDLEHKRRYMKVLSHDGTNSTQIVTDIYNMFIQPRVIDVYPEIFKKGSLKREETMGSFTTSTGVKVASGTVGQSQRGHVQDNARPDFVWFEDFETKNTLRSAVVTQSIWNNMEEARTGLAKGGSCIYTGNYISEAGNVHKLKNIKSNNRKVLIVPIMDDKGVPTWDRYTAEDIEEMKKVDDNFEGERMCKPSASRDVYFSREELEKQIIIKPIKTIGGLKIFKEYNASHEYAAAHDIAGGVGLDSSTSVIIDFSTIPAQVVGTYVNNLVKPDVFAFEIKDQVEQFGNCISSPECNNHGHATIAMLKILGVAMYERKKDDIKVSEGYAVEYGWQTNTLTKNKMLTELRSAIDSGLLTINDEDLYNELKSYTRNDLMDNIRDPRLATRHFDLLVALAIAWQMRFDRLPSNNSQKINKAKSIIRNKSITKMTKYGG